ncbi:copper amine oxidase N-terminal domain-containing protein [Paenibacillus sacheonensis]|nr:copper amine oxidase N-terminal domain-containing protein [Paenibacillus sacheonensis]
MQAPIPSQRPQPNTGHSAPAPGTTAASSPGTSGQTRITAKAAKRMLVLSALLALLFAVLASLVTYLLDPLQFYHKPFGYKPIFSSEQRYQNPGLALHYDYDTIILGTSMTENFLPSEVDKALGGKTLKLSIRGSTADEQYQIAKLAIGTGKVKQALWGLDYFALKTGDQESAGPFPAYLYDRNRWNDYRYLLNYSVYGQFFRGVYKELTGSGVQSLEKLYNWNDSVTFGKKEVLAHYRTAAQEEAYFGLNEDPLDVIQANFDTEVLALVKAHPEVKFIFYYPPYSVLREAVWASTNAERYRNQLEMDVWMFERLNGLPNAEVYNFQTAGEWTYDLDRYKDLSHHDQAINTAIIHTIGAGDSRYRMTTANAQALSDELEEQVRTLALTETGDPKSVQLLVGSAASSAKEVWFSSLAIPGEGELLVPAKEAAAALGATLDWNQATKTLTLAHAANRVSLTLDQTKAVDKDGSTIELAQPARLVGGQTQVPLLRLASVLGYDVSEERPNAWSLRYTVTERAAK